MAQTPRFRTYTTFVILLALGLFIAACEQGESPTGNENTVGSLTIEAGAMGASSWVLIAPDGTESSGVGDTLIVNPQVGDYWLLWEPVEAWHSPQENPYRLSYKRGDIAEIQARYESIVGGMGSLRVDPQLNGAAAAWNMHGPNGFFAAGQGKKTMNKRATGTYTVIWESVDGFITPPQTTGELDDNGVLTLNADYQPVSGGAGEIDIIVNPEGLGAPWQLQLGTGGTWSGVGDETLGSMPVGDYTIIWGAMDGYDAPSPEIASLANGERIVLTGNYEQLPDPVGAITVDVTPDGIGASWVLSSSAGARFEGTGDKRFEGIPAGQWTLTPAPVDGYVTPPTTSVLLATGWDLTWDVNYVAESAPMGSLAINPDPDGIAAPWQVRSGSGVVRSGNGDQLVANLPVGDYEVAWGDVAGYVTPAVQPVSIQDGQTSQADAIYEPEADPLGTIVIDPNPDSINAPWQVVLPDGEILSGQGDRTLVDMPMGEYTLTWGTVEGWQAPSPNPVTQTLAPGGVMMFSMR